MSTSPISSGTGCISISPASTSGSASFLGIRWVPRRNFDRTIFRHNSNQAKADYQHVSGQREVWSFGEQWTLIVSMNALVVRSAKRHITSPLIGDYSVVHHAVHDAEHLSVKEEFWNKARRLEGHWQEMAVGAAVRLVAVVLEIREEKRPKPVSTSIDQRLREVFSEYA